MIQGVRVVGADLQRVLERRAGLGVAPSAGQRPAELEIVGGRSAGADRTLQSPDGARPGCVGAMQQPNLIQRCGVVPIAPQRAGEQRPCARAVAEPQMQRASRAGIAGLRRVERSCTLVGRQRGIPVLQRLGDGRSVVVQIGAFGSQLRGALEVACGCAQLPTLAVGQAKRVLITGVVRVERQRPTIGLEGLLVVPLAPEQHGQLAMGLGAIGAELQHRPQHERRLIVVAVFAQQCAQPQLVGHATQV